jgi:hypothetical protein
MEKKETNQSTVPGKIKILFLAANPAFTPPLKIDEEIRAINQKIRAAEYRDSIELVSAWAVRPDDLQQILLEHKPHIVHFSGHGESTGELILLDKDGNPKPVKPEAIQALFTVLKDNIRIVFFNACYTEKQARAINEVIDCVIGMNTYISDQAATVFAASFYRALGFGRSVKEAFDLGKTALVLEGISEENTPILLTKAGIDPSKIHIGPIMEEEETKKLLEAGLELFNLKDYNAASENFQKARKLTPTNKKAQFFYCLSSLSGKPVGSIDISKMDEINNILNNIIHEKDLKTANLARIVLGIIRYDYYKHRNYHYQGIPSVEIFKQLEDYYPSNEEKQLIHHIAFSDTVKSLFNLS